MHLIFVKIFTIFGVREKNFGGGGLGKGALHYSICVTRIIRGGASSQETGFRNFNN